MSVLIGGVGRWGVVLGLSAFLVGGAAVISAAQGPGRVISVSQKLQKKKAAAKKGDDAMPKEDMDAAAAAKAAAPADGSLSFKRDIAPILVANCLGCHSGTGRGITVGKLDMSTFDKLMAGGKRGKDIVSGDAEGSMLVKMIKGEETPKMPPNNGQRGFAEEAAVKIETWVKQGATLDAGVASTDPINKYAASLDDLRKSELSKLSPDERDKLAEQAGLERWKKATKITPDVTKSAKGGHFLLLSNLPKERATKLLQTMETQYTLTNKLLSGPKGPALDPLEKIGIYVFKENVPFVEFVRTNENQEVETGEQARAKLGVESPYIVAVDPAAGGEEAASTSARKGARKKKGEEPSGGPERLLAGVLTEQLVAGAANKAGKPPRWVSLGLGAFMASHVETPGSPYYRRLRVEIGESIRIGWQPKANEALGGEAKVETTRAIGFGLFQWIAANAPPATLANFVRVMLEGQGKLDDALAGCLNLTRQEFLEGSELWLSEHYGRP
jgi:Planctomycete cytochrome C